MNEFKEGIRLQRIIGDIENDIEGGRIEDVIVEQSNGGISYGIIDKKAIVRVRSLTAEEHTKLAALSEKARLGVKIREEFTEKKNRGYDELLESFTEEYKPPVRYTDSDLDELAKYPTVKTIKQEPKKIKNKRFTFNKIKIKVEDLLDKIGSISISEKQKVKIKKTIKNAIDKGKKYIAIGLASLIAIFGSIYIAKQISDQSRVGEEITVENEMEEDTTVKTREENKIDTIEEVKTDFVKKYLKAYNEAYGTRYTQADLMTTFLSGTSIYQLSDGRKVTRGNYPYETEEQLNQIGEYKAIPMNSDLIQIVLLNGKILGSYNIMTGEFIYSGNQRGDLTKEGFEAPTLEKLGINPDKLEAAAKVNMAQYGEDRESINKRIKEYNGIPILVKDVMDNATVEHEER